MIRTWAPWVWGSTIKALYKSTFFTFTFNYQSKVHEQNDRYRSVFSEKETGTNVLGIKQVKVTTLTSCKCMTGVETNSNSRLVFNPVDNATQLQKAAADRSSLSGHVLQHCNILPCSNDRHVKSSPTHCSASECSHSSNMSKRLTRSCSHKIVMMMSRMV